MLRRALKSITLQSFDPWEALIVNDGGEPRAVEDVVEEFRSVAGGRVRVLHNEHPTGRWPAANAGVTGTSAPFVVLHDDDDAWHPDFLKTTVAYLDAHPDEVGVIVRTEVVLEKFDDSGALVETGRYVLEHQNPEVLATDLLQFNRFVPIGFLYRRTLHDRIGLYDDELPAAADWAFNMRTMLLHQVRYAGSDVLAYWHQRPGIDGVEGNSVFAAPADHQFADRAHRDKELRAYMADHGWGLPLYLATSLERQRIAAEESEKRLMHEMSTRFVELEEAVTALQRHLDRTLDTRLRGWVWRQKQHFRRGRKRSAA